MDLHELRGQVGLVSQEPVLFSCTVRDNICCANPEATQQQVEDAARAANAHAFVQKLPEGYNTQVSYFARKMIEIDVLRSCATPRLFKRAKKGQQSIALMFHC